jgi:undecaprenyl-diphosphatase
MPRDCLGNGGRFDSEPTPSRGSWSEEMGTRVELLWQRFDRLEQSACVAINRASRYASVRRFFTTVSRLGDGIFWYLLMLAFAIQSVHGAKIALQMAVGGLISFALYKQLKQKLLRERPYISHAGIELGTAPLDRYSFPSGHTLHAVCFTTLACNHVPELGPVLLPFTALVGASRVILGLHYPTDVAAGATLGFGIAAGVLTFLPT